MQIDFHHGTTYVVARLAGFEHDDAAIVAACAQYVDDATNEGIVRFDTGARYARLASAHKMLDYRNFEELSTRRVWIPFHFVPGNGGLPAGEAPEGGEIDKLVCTPDSHPAQDLVRAAIEDRDRPWGLHRLGIAVHVYVDTWAHQGFAGIVHPVNRATDIHGATGTADEALLDKLGAFFRDMWDQAQGAFIDEVLPLGHGAVLSKPDLPFAVWSYTDGLGRRILRDNPTDFLTAADRMCVAMRRYLLGDPAADVSGLPPDGKAAIERMLRGLKMHDGEIRHRAWLDAIATPVEHGVDRNRFGFSPVELRYLPKGRGSWKHAALGTEASVDTGDEQFAYDPLFLRSHWKAFHDGLQAHRFDLVHEILPRYGICTA